MKRFGRIFTGLVSLGVLAGSIYGIAHAQDIMDWWRLRGYEPPARIVQLADKTTMKPEARRIFYVERPQLDDKSAFRRHCPDASEQSIVLGCYVQRSGIYLLDVTDQRLSGVIEVTAAHEFLHAEYARLSKKERENVDRMTANFFSQVTDQRIKDTVERYRADDPAVVPNELHSILASEVRDLSPELEAYYSRYFANRQQIVSFSENYEQTFVKLESQVQDYDKQLAGLKQEIQANQAELEIQGKQVEDQRDLLDKLLRANQTEEYNAAVPEFNALVGRYNQLITATKELMDRHNALVEERNAIATTEQELIQAINSKIEPKATE